MSTPAQVTANRANALRSTGPRTPEGKSISSRNALSHGAYASDDTLLAISIPPTMDPTPADPTAPQPATAGVLPGVPPPQEAAGSYLATYTRHYVPVGPAEELLVRRLAACAARLDLLAQSLTALMTLDERRALLEHIDERYSLSTPATQLRRQPDWTGPIHRYDNLPYVAPFPEEKPDNPALDPAATACTLAYTITSPRAAILFQLEERTDRRFLTTLKELLSLQALRRRSLPTHPGAPTPEQSLIEAIDLRVRRILSAHGLDPDARPVPKPKPVIGNEPNAANKPAGSIEPGDQNKPTAPTSLPDGNEPNPTTTSQPALATTMHIPSPPNPSEPIDVLPISAGVAAADPSLPLYLHKEANLSPRHLPPYTRPAPASPRRSGTNPIPPPSHRMPSHCCGKSAAPTAHHTPTAATSAVPNPAGTTLDRALLLRLLKQTASPVLYRPLGVYHAWVATPAIWQNSLDHVWSRPCHDHLWSGCGE